MLAAFQSLAKVSLLSPSHSIAWSVTEQFDKSGIVPSSKVSVALSVVALPQSSVIV